MALIDEVAEARSYYYHGIQNALWGSQLKELLTSVGGVAPPESARLYHGQHGYDMDWEGLDELLDMNEVDLSL